MTENRKGFGFGVFIVTYTIKTQKAHIIYARSNLVLVLPLSDSISIVFQGGGSPYAQKNVKHDCLHGFTEVRFISIQEFGKRTMRSLNLDLFWKRLSANAVTIRPYTLTLSALILTVSVARLISYRAPRFHWEPQAGLHVHHYAFGIFALAIAGYTALVFKGPRATFWIALLYGFGMGLVFDEFGLWLHLQEAHGLRWNNTGLLIVAAAFFFIGIACTSIFKRGFRRKVDESLSVTRSDAEMYGLGESD